LGKIGQGDSLELHRKIVIYVECSRVLDQYKNEVFVDSLIASIVRAIEGSARSCSPHAKVVNLSDRTLRYLADSLGI
jgi:hypothetical protein